MAQNINMPELVSTDNANAMMIGVYLQYTKGFMDFAIDQIKDYSIVINMPCGHVLIIDERDKFPTSNVACSCGDPNHWFVKLKEIENE